MAKTLANLHKITKNHKPKYSRYRQVLSKKQIRVDLKSQESRLDKNKFRKLEDYIKNNLEKIDFPKSLPKGTIHGDYNLGNVLFKGEEISCVLDFDDSCYTYLIIDLASMILFVAWPDEMPLNKVELKG